MKKILLDTSVIIDFIRRKDKNSTLLYKLSEEDLFISIITHTELYAGKSVWDNNSMKSTLTQLFFGIRIISLTLDISEKAGFLRAHNTQISLIDSIIAATAMINKLELATFNIKDFENISGLMMYTYKIT